MNYYTSSLIHLELERFHNAGLTTEKTREVIESIPDPGSTRLNLYCTQSGINGNWSVHTQCTNPKSIAWIVDIIDERLSQLIAID